MKAPTPQEIEAEIKALEACKSYIPSVTVFGDNNIRKVDLQIEFLKGEIDTTTDEFYEEYSQDEQSAVLEAQSWQEGESEDGTPSSGWDSWKPKSEPAKKKKK